MATAQQPDTTTHSIFPTPIISFKDKHAFFSPDCVRVRGAGGAGAGGHGDGEARGVPHLRRLLAPAQLQL